MRRTRGQFTAPSRLVRRATMLVAALLLAVASALLVTRSTSVMAANPTPPFTQCPAVGADTGCALLIVIQPDGSLTVLSDPTQKPIDNADDTLLGVQNNSAITVPSISIGSATLAVFGFENDGICIFAFTGNAYCTATPKPPTGYEGPDTTFSNISANKRDGTVRFTDPGGGLAAGASTYFSLENKILATQLGTGAVTSLVFTAASATTSDNAELGDRGRDAAQRRGAGGECSGDIHARARTVVGELHRDDRRDGNRLVLAGAP